LGGIVGFLRREERMEVKERMEVIDRWSKQDMALELRRDSGLLDNKGRPRIIFVGTGSRTFTWSNVQTNGTVAPLVERLEEWKDATERERLLLETERQANAEGEAKLQRENGVLAKAVLDLTRRLTVAEQRAKNAEDITAQLSVTHFPAGEEPEARWDITELGRRALASGVAEGPTWTLLLSPDPREVLSIEVRAGSREEEIYRLAGYVTADDPDTKGGHFLGLLEAVVEAAQAEDADLGRAMGALERLFLVGLQEHAAKALARLDDRVCGLFRDELVDPGPQACSEAVKRARENRPAPSYDLSAICARCGERYDAHLTGCHCAACDGFLAVEPDP
jgi:hypothetical protein